jgi:predicted Ser/Thr protein kinase
VPEVSPLKPGDPAAMAGYRLAGRLGEGGQGTVYLGYAAGGEPVAVKVLHARVAGDETARKRFAREISTAGRVAPFCTARVLAAEVEGDVPYLVSELIEGPSLRDVVRRDGPMRGAALDRLAVGTLTALTAIHRAGVVHRDFKPGNVLLSPQGPRVVDFGIARALDGTSTLTSQAVGTPSYMAPEQLEGQTIGPAADLFAWGCTMVHSATGRPPFGVDNVPAIIGRILDEEPDLGDLTGPLRDMVARCLDKNPAARPTAEQLLIHLLGRPTGPVEATLAEGARAVGTMTTIADGFGRDPMGPTTVGATPPPAGRGRPTSRRRALIAGAAATAIVVLAGAGVLAWPGGAAGHPAAHRPATATPISTPPLPTPFVPARVPGWNTVIDKVEKIAYDVPRSWDAGTRGEVGYPESAKKPTFTLFAAGVYGKSPCKSDGYFKPRAAVGFMAYDKADLRLVAEDASTLGAAARYSHDGHKAATRARTIESLSVNGMKVAHASATVVAVPDNCGYPSSAVIHAVAMASPGVPNKVAVFVVMADRNVTQAVPDQTLRQIIGSLRPASN